MEAMTMRELAAAIGCAQDVSGSVGVISTDSRDMPTGCLFIALAGERFNGHDYIDAAFEAGALYAVAHERRGYSRADRVLYVPDTQIALMQIGRAYREKFDIRCVGITGSVGKTTTKDMIAEVVSSGFKTLKTQANLNNEIGLSKTLLELDGSYGAAVLEMGMQGAGEIEALAKTALPNIGVITNVGVSHIERLGSRENILRAKLELADCLPDGAPLILCGDNDLLREVKLPRLNVRFYGIENPECAFSAVDIREGADETSFTIRHENTQLPVIIPCVGRHNVLNALAACAVGIELGIPAARCATALAGYIPSGMRQKIVRRDGYTVIEDCYNASPDSMSAAIKTLASYPCEGRKIAVFGEMLELGEIAREAHAQVGRLAAAEKLDLLLAYGGHAADCAGAARENGLEAIAFSDKCELLAELKARLGGGDVIWVKGSRGTRMEEILLGLYDGGLQTKTPGETPQRSQSDSGTSAQNPDGERKNK